MQRLGRTEVPVSVFQQRIPFSLEFSIIVAIHIVVGASVYGTRMNAGWLGGGWQLGADPQTPSSSDRGILLEYAGEEVCVSSTAMAVAGTVRKVGLAINHPIDGGVYLKDASTNLSACVESSLKGRKDAELPCREMGSAATTAPSSQRSEALQ